MASYGINFGLPTIPPEVRKQFREVMPVGETGVYLPAFPNLSPKTKAMLVGVTDSIQDCHDMIAQGTNETRRFGVVIKSKYGLPRIPGGPVWRALYAFHIPRISSASDLPPYTGE